MDEKENIKRTDIDVHFIRDDLISDFFIDVKGYQVTQSVIAITDSNHRQIIIPLVNIYNITVTIKE